MNDTAIDVRAQLEAEVFDGAERVNDEPIVESVADTAIAPEPENVEPSNPWAGVNPALREQFDSIQGKLGVIDQITNRLKTAEGRVSALQSDLAKRAVERAASNNAPSKAQVVAVKTDAEWEALKEDFPEWANGTDKRIESRLAALRAEIPDVSALRESLVAEHKQAQATVSETIERRLVEFKHPGYREIVKTQEFVEFYSKLDEAGKARGASMKADDAIWLLDTFNESKNKSKASMEREKRLKQAESFRGVHEPPTKSEDDLTEAELRKRLEKQIWE